MAKNQTVHLMSSRQLRKCSERRFQGTKTKIGAQAAILGNLKKQGVHTIQQLEFTPLRQAVPGYRNLKFDF